MSALALAAARPTAGDDPALAEAYEPPEARGAARDEVRMLVSRGDGSLEHRIARDLPEVLEPGDLVVVNTSATLPAALDARRADGTRVELHLSTPARDCPGAWLVELRRGGRRYRGGTAGEQLALPGGGFARLLARDLAAGRLWLAELALETTVDEYLAAHGRPIRYAHTRGEWPLAAYQTAFAREPGSAEMPSAGRPLTPAVVTALVSREIVVAPVLLHTGVSSLETGELPYPERYAVPAHTARLATATRRWGGRVIAVGTTVVRALETVSRPDGSVAAGDGWTDVVVTPERGVRAVDGLLTGWHESGSSHLELLRAVGGSARLARASAEAERAGYRAHEFGDVHLLLP